MEWNPLPPLEELNKYYQYMPLTGQVFLKEMRCNSDAKRVGRPVGNLRKRGDRFVWTINHKYKNFYLSRIIWKIMTSEDPGQLIVEHKNRDSTDNRWENLRLATCSQNVVNQFSLGYQKRKDTGKYRARITVNGKRISLGSFNTENEARKALIDARKKYYGQFAYLDL